MIRLLFSIGISVVVARWAYQEVELCAPQLVPMIDYTLEQVKIPTHDKWLRTALTNAAQLVQEGKFEDKLAAMARAPQNNSRSVKQARELPPEPPQGFSTVAYSGKNAFERF